jgi:hypothetical protein
MCFETFHKPDEMKTIDKKASLCRTFYILFTMSDSTKKKKAVEKMLKCGFVFRFYTFPFAIAREKRENCREIHLIRSRLFEYILRVCGLRYVNEMHGICCKSRWGK